jgi:hypothetical protein
MKQKLIVAFATAIFILGMQSASLRIAEVRG